MKKAEIFVNKNFVVGEIDRRIFGSFIEHLGRAVYTGIYEPGHPTATKEGFRQDVIDAIKELNVSVVRYPGGNYVSGFNWRDSIGDYRPRRLELAWLTIETNQFGIHEFAKWCDCANVEPMMAINMGTDSIKSAAEEVEYCNHENGTDISELRIKNGAKDPFNFKLWCIGNEMDGGWQIGHLSADEYGKKARETAKIMRLANGEQWNTPLDKRLKLVVTGSSAKEMPTFPDWDRTVLEYTYDLVDYLSMHRYYAYNKNGKNPIADFLGAPTDMDEFIKTIEGTIAYVKAKNRINKEVYISFDEWNIWDSTVPSTHEVWDIAPAIFESKYSFLDSLVVAGLMNTLLNHANSVKVACLAQLVNTIAPITTKAGGGILKQTIFYPFALASNNASGVTLQSQNTSDSFDSSYGRSKEINQAVTYNKETGELTFLICNFANEEIEINSDISSFGNAKVVDSKVMSSEDLFATNDFGNEFNIVPVPQDVKIAKNALNFTAKPYSYNFIKVSVEPQK